MTEPTTHDDDWTPADAARLRARFDAAARSRPGPASRPSAPIRRRRRVIDLGATAVAPELPALAAATGPPDGPCARCKHNHMASFDCMSLPPSAWTTGMFARAVLGVQR